MFSFQVRKVGEQRLGSIVSGPMDHDTGQGRPMEVSVVVMWDDDFSFSVHNVEDIQAVPTEEPKLAQISMFPGGGDETAH